MSKAEIKKTGERTYINKCIWHGGECGYCFSRNGDGNEPICFKAIKPVKKVFGRKHLAKLYK